MEEDDITHLITIVVLVAAGAVVFGAVPALAADPANPDWPCVQRKVASLTSAQMWDGPAVDDLTGWRGRDDIKKLIAVLANRRVPLDEAVESVARFADVQPPDKRDDALKLLFAGLLDFVNNDRAVVMSGIERFQQRQKARAAEIERQGAVLRQLKEQAASDPNARSELTAAEDRYQWDVRVFTERQQSLPLTCEVPVLIEQRLFELGREIRSRMND
ncbi:MAG: hypothetical protein GEU95_20045 [Rhizobiales bacterium]|nr:hypothetical protein [Hyphomicrobiales bacterium]